MTWECKQGCDLSDGTICKHLEALLPPADGGDDRRKVSYYHDLSNVDSDKTLADVIGETDELVTAVRNLPLDEFEQSIFIDRFLYRDSFSKIARDYNLKDYREAQTVLRNIYRKVREVVNQ